MPTTIDQDATPSRAPEFKPGDMVRSVDVIPDDADESPGFYENMLSLRGKVLSGPYQDGSYEVRCHNGGSWYFGPHWLRHDTDAEQPAAGNAGA